MTRALDALVAERVMGWLKVQTCGIGLWCPPNARRYFSYALDGHDGTEEQQPDTYSFGPDSEISRLMTVPRYSTEITIAWTVVDEMKSRGIVFMLTSSTHGDAVSFVLLNAPTIPVGACKKPGEIEYGAPRSICLAALRAVGVPEDEIAEATK